MPALSTPAISSATSGRTPVRPVASVESRSSISPRTTSRSTSGPEPAACERTSERCSWARISVGMCRVARAPNPVEMPYAGVGAAASSSTTARARSMAASGSSLERDRGAAARDGDDLLEGERADAHPDGVRRCYRNGGRGRRSHATIQRPAGVRCQTGSDPACLGSRDIPGIRSATRRAMRSSRTACWLLLLVVLVGTGCEAPLAARVEAGRAARPARPRRRGPTPPRADDPPSPSPTPLAEPDRAPPSRSPRSRSRGDLGPVLGADVSWPQCPKGMGIPQKRSQGSPMPVDAARYVIIGLTNGPGFYPNPCLAARSPGSGAATCWPAPYSVISYPEQRHLAAYRTRGPTTAAPGSAR